VCDTDVKAARIVKGRLEKTTLGQIVEEITQKLSPGVCFVKVTPCVPPDAALPSLTRLLLCARRSS
jgi:hypothetical protein